MEWNEGAPPFSFFRLERLERCISSNEKIEKLLQNVLWSALLLLTLKRFFFHSGYKPPWGGEQQ